MSNLAQRRLEALQKQLLLENLQSNVGDPNQSLIKVIKTPDNKGKVVSKTQTEAATKAGPSSAYKSPSARLLLKGSKNESTPKEKEKASLTRLFKIKKDSAKRGKVLKDANSSICTSKSPNVNSNKSLNKKKSISPKNEKGKKAHKNDAETKKISTTATESAAKKKETRKNLLLKLVERRTKIKNKVEPLTSIKKSAKLKQNDKKNESSKIKKILSSVSSTKTSETEKVKGKKCLATSEDKEIEKHKNKQSVGEMSVIDQENLTVKKTSSSSITNFKIPKVPSTVISTSEESTTKQNILETKSAESLDSSTFVIPKTEPTECETPQIPKASSKPFQFSSVTDRLTRTLDHIIAFFTPNDEKQNIQKNLDSKSMETEPSPHCTGSSTVEVPQFIEEPPSVALQSCSSIVKPLEFSNTVGSHVTSVTTVTEPVSSGDETMKTQNLINKSEIGELDQFSLKIQKSNNETEEFVAAPHCSNLSVNLFQFKTPDLPKDDMKETIKNSFEILRAGKSEKYEISKTTTTPTEKFKFSFESQHPKDENKISALTKVKISSDDCVMADCSKRIKLANNDFISSFQRQPAETYLRRKNIANNRLQQIREKLAEENFDAGLSSTPLFGNLCQDSDCSSGSGSFASCQSQSTSEFENDEPMEVDDPMEIDESEITAKCVSSLEYNLLKLTEKKSSSLKLSAKNKFCIVLDTNVLLKDLVFIERITSVEFPAFGKPIVIVPYCVLQELDTLKQPRPSSQKNVSVFARNAIRYINEALTKDPPEVKGQSGTEDRDHRIFIKSADDCIINCCLQIADVCKRLILISYDKNLVNKAIFNGISSCSPQELMNSVDNT